MNPLVKRVNPQKDFTLLLEFENGEVRSFDMKRYTGKGVFRRLQRLPDFLTARVVAGSVEWIGEVDLSYDTLYLESTRA